MYSPAQLKTGLIGLVGWRQNYDPSGTQLAGLTTSTSGLYFNDEHPLLNIENLLSIAPEFSKLSAPAAWDSGTAYAVGGLVRVGGVNYRATAASTNQTPPDTDYWEVYDAFTAWLKEKTEAGIIRAIDAWMERKFFLNTGRNLLERKQLLETAGNITDLDTNAGRVAGLEITPVRSRNIIATIEAVGLQFDTSQAITVYLFSSTQAAPLQSQAVTYATAGALQWEAVNWTLDGAGAYYIVVDQADITGQSINGVYEHANACGGIAQIPGGKFFRATAFDVAGDISALWDLDGMSYTRTTNYGLNLRLNLQCDFTALILEQKNLFATLIRKQVAIDLLRELAFNPTSRINRHEANIDRTTLLYEIDGDSQGRPGGLRKQLEDAINSIQLDSTNIDKYCLPCRRLGVKYKTV